MGTDKRGEKGGASYQSRAMISVCPVATSASVKARSLASDLQRYREREMNLALILPSINGPNPDLANSTVSMLAPGRVERSLDVYVSSCSAEGMILSEEVSKTPPSFPSAPLLMASTSRGWL